jgi:hypothetical protein
MCLPPAALAFFPPVVQAVMQAVKAGWINIHCDLNPLLHTALSRIAPRLRLRSGTWRARRVYFWRENIYLFFLFNYCTFTIYSRYIKRVISKRDECVYLKQVPSSDGSLELI